jgi:ABC-type oligopeptide transport system substrate-binding subunit
MSRGTAQIFQWGWNADYPDPENFLFLLYGPNMKVGKHGENAGNYENPTFDVLFQKMVNLENSPKRLEIIKKMLHILQEDAPWIWGLHPIGFGLYHEWYLNAYPNKMANNTLKYKKIDPEIRMKRRREWNQPIFWPVVVLSVIFIVTIVPPAIRIYRKQVD